MKYRYHTENMVDFVLNICLLKFFGFKPE